MSIVTGGLLKGFGPTSGGAVTPPTEPTLAMADDGDGTCTATISGSDVGTTNTVYSFPIGGGTKTARGTPRSGDGTVDITIAVGVYLWQVKSEDGDGCTSWSNVVQLRVTDGTEAVYEQILTQVQADIQAIGMSGVSSDDIILHKVPEDVVGHAKPYILVSPFNGEKNLEGTTNKDDTVYQVMVACIDSGNRNQTSNRNRWLMWRQQIRRTFEQKRLSSITSVYKTEVTFRDVVDPNAWFNRNDMVGGLLLNVYSREARTV